MSVIMHRQILYKQQFLHIICRFFACFCKCKENRMIVCKMYHLTGLICETVACSWTRTIPTFCHCYLLVYLATEQDAVNRRRAVH